MVTPEAVNVDRDTDTPRMVHLSAGEDYTRSLCGAPVLGRLAPDKKLDCVVCAELDRSEA